MFILTATPSQRERNRLERRAAIVRSARQMFLDRGYAATPMSTIAARLGGSKTTLWSYFPSKEDLFAAVLDDLIVELRAGLEDTLQPDRDIRTTLLAFGNRFLDRMLAPEAVSLARLVVGEAGRFPEVGKIFYDKGPRQTMQRLEGYFGQCIASGSLRDVEPHVMVDHFIGMIQSLMYQHRLWNVAERPEAASRERHVEATVEMFLRAYSA